MPNKKMRRSKTAIRQLMVPALTSHVVTGEGTVDVKLINCKWMSETYSDTFERRPIEAIERLPNGMFVKVFCLWPDERLLPERFWVEIRSSHVTESGQLVYFGEIRNDTLIGQWGDPIGPMMIECFCDMDLEAYVEDYLGEFAKEVQQSSNVA